jgi:hypothetical protein
MGRCSKEESKPEKPGNGNTSKGVKPPVPQEPPPPPAPTPSANEVNIRPARPETCGKPWKTPLMEMRGKVQKVEYRKPPWSSQKGLHLDVQTIGKQDIVIHVFPEQLITQCQNLFTFKEGELVTVSGSEFLTEAGKQMNICAAEIIRSAGVLNLRNPITGSLEKEACCQEICGKRCTGRPPFCRRRCMDRCSTENLF